MKIAVLLFILVVTSTGYPQEKVPDVNSVSSRFERIELIRMRADMNMLEGLNTFVKENAVNNAVILTGIGSVTDYHFHVVSDKNLPPAEEFPRASVAMDLIAVQGYILNGRVHAHITLSEENSVVGGHLEPGTKAQTFSYIDYMILLSLNR